MNEPYFLECYSCGYVGELDTFDLVPHARQCRRCESCEVHGSRTPLGHLKEVARRLEYLRAELRGERLSYGDLVELESLAPFINPEDVELLEAANVEEWLPKS